MRLARVLCVVAVAAACREPGTARIEVMLDPAACPAYANATHVHVYLLQGATCAACTCGSCFDACNDATCVAGCPDGACPIDELGSIRIDSARPGVQAAILDFFAGADVVASACADLDLAEDGTDDVDITAEGTCCAP
jgi:hypothetical protein